MTKTCSKCGETKEADGFYKGRRTCIDCCKKQRTARYAADPSKELERNKKWKAANKGKQVNYYREFCDRNPSNEIYRSAKRRAAKLKATPSWSNLTAIKAIYELSSKISEVTGVLHHVDHIHPLQSDVVCGLHVIENLRIIPATENLSKSNKFIEGGV